MELVSIDVLLLFFQVINDVLKIIFRGNHFRFGSVFIKKNKNQTGFYKKKTETETEAVQTYWFWFGYFRTKTGSNWFGSVFSGLT